MSNDNGDLKKEEPIMDSVVRGVPTEEKSKDEINAELKKKFEADVQKNIQNYKDFITPGTILIVRLNEQGTPQWITSLQPEYLNMLLDRMKYCVLNPKPMEAPLIQKPKGIIADLKGAFGKKRF